MLNFFRSTQPGELSDQAKSVSIFGDEISIVGSPEDAYFQGLGSPHRDEVLRVARHVIKKSDVVFDIGANIGVTALAFSGMAPQGNVFAFEPGAANYNLLAANIRRNDRANIAVKHCAIGVSDGSIRFYESAEYGAGSFTMGDRSDPATKLFDSRLKVQDVTLRSIDSLIKEIRPSRLDVIKIDVEGAEPQVLAGAKDTLAQFRPTVILEFNSQNLIMYHDASPRQFLVSLLAIFDQVFWIDRGSGELVAVETEAHANHFAMFNLRNGFVDNFLCTYRERSISEKTVAPIAKDEHGMSWISEGSADTGMVPRRDYDWLKQQYDTLKNA